MRAKFALRLLLLIWHQSYHTVSNSALWTSQICVCYWDYGKSRNPKEGKFSRKVVQILAILSYKDTKSPNIVFNKIKEKTIFQTI